MKKTDKEKLFGNLDLKKSYSDHDFKEDSVREEIILPIIKKLGYNSSDIIRSKALQHPYLKVGTNKIPIKLIPDYILKVNGVYAWVLDAKSKEQNIDDGENVSQVYSYAIHPEVRSTYFAICNGIKFIIFKTDSIKPVLKLSIDEIEEKWEEIYRLVSPDSFHLGKKFVYENNNTKEQKVFDYLNRPLLEELPVKKQQAKRHFGVHGYFTKQSWNVVAEYIKNYTQQGDLVLDPFGGSGVTAIEAMMNKRRAINIDLNPMAVFIVGSLITPVKQMEFIEAFEQVKKEYLKNEPKTTVEINKILKKIAHPEGFKLPIGSDVANVEQLFSNKQLAELSLLKAIIYKQKNENIRNSLLLAFSSTINKHNLTFHYTQSDGGGDSAAFRYYRYRIAPDPGQMPLMQIYETKYKKVLSAKNEIEYFINENTISNIRVIKGTATKLNFIKNESIDYIYTDPPYGKKIPYLDLSVMWNAWLDLEVTEQDYKEEAIEGGKNDKTKVEYNRLISDSIKEMYRVLKFDRWVSFVFAHKDPEFWHLIIDTAEFCGFEYAGAVSQKNGQTSFKKRQNPFTVLSGQLIINFKKVRNPKTIMKANLGIDISEIVIQTIEGIIAKNNGATLEQINDELIIKGLELGFLDLLKKEYSDLTPILMNTFDYNEKEQRFKIKPNTKFKTSIDVNLRIQYYLISYLRRMERENINPHFDDIVLNILPLLKNGITPESQTILNVLQSIAEHTGKDCWRLKKKEKTLFD